MPTPDKALNPIEAYLAEIEKDLRRRLPADIAGQRVAEARDHLTGRAAELAATGMAPAQAQATAVSAFGPAQEWARSIAEAAYADAGAIRARRIATAAGIVVMAATFFSLWGEGPIVFHLCWAVFCFGLLTVAVGAFRSRRSATWALLGAAIVGALAMFLWEGATYIDGAQNMPVKRSEIATGLRVEAFKLAEDDSECDQLRLGLKTYDRASGPLPAAIPSAIMANGGYIVPKPLVVRGSRYNYSISLATDDPWESAFKVYTPEQREEFRNRDWERSLLARIRLTQAAPARTVGTEAVAAKEWRAWGPYWLNTISDGIENDRVWLASYRTAAAHPNRFGWHWGTDRTIAWFLVFAAPAVLVDFLAAGVGRWVFRRFRRRDPIQIAMT